VPLLDLKAQYATIRDEVRAAIDRVVESQHFILGPEVEALEREVAAERGVLRCLDWPEDQPLDPGGFLRVLA